jgi:hypothetical protein
MNTTFEDIINHVSKYEVAVAKAQFMFESQIGIKLDKMTDFLLKFIYTEHLDGKDVTMTILANTTMTNDNTIRAKLKILIKHDLVEICRCGCDGRTKKILPTKFLKQLMVVDVASKLKTAESISKPFTLLFGDSLMKFYKEYGLEKYEAFSQYDKFNFYKTVCEKCQSKQKNTLKKLA